MSSSSNLGVSNPTPLVMIRADINVRDFHLWAGKKRLWDTGYAMHCLLTECFGDLAPKPFRLILPQGILYGYGGAGAEALQEAIRMFGDPRQCRIFAELDSKVMPFSWQVDTRLGFETRVRPIVRRSRNAACGPGRERDAFQVAAIQHAKRTTAPPSREDVYAEWLNRQFARRGGAHLEKTVLHSFQRTRTTRKQGTRASEGPDAIMRGVLTVTDANAFAKLLARGVGRHRAYGYGMLLLRPVTAGVSTQP